MSDGKGSTINVELDTMEPVRIGGDDNVTPELEILVHYSEWDGALVVQIDTNDVRGRLRVNVNDGPPVFECDPDTDAVHGSNGGHFSEASDSHCYVPSGRN